MITVKGEVDMGKTIRTEAVDSLFDAIMCLENKEECYTFFEDICTINELLSLSQRFEVAKMLREQRTYLEIAEKTGLNPFVVGKYQTQAKSFSTKELRAIIEDSVDTEEAVKTGKLTDSLGVELFIMKYSAK